MKQPECKKVIMPVAGEQKGNSIHNRERILQAAIALFSERGFSGVSQREIAAAVGIQAASIYNHFASKEMILEEIIKRFRAGLEECVMPAFSTENLLDLRAYLARIGSATDAYFADPTNMQIGHIVLREQFFNKIVRGMLYETLIVQPRVYMGAYFLRLMRAGLMREWNPEFAAKEYHAFFVYEFYENALSFGITVESEQTQQQRNEHVERFIESWSIGGAKS